MKKQLWFLRKLFKSIRGRLILLWVQVLLLSLAINFCLIFPVSTMMGYNVYDGSGLENVGLFTIGYQFIYWNDRIDSPAYNQLVDELSQFGEIGEINETWADSADIPDGSLRMIIYPEIFVDRILLPIADSPAALRDANRSDSLPLILDARLHNAWELGQETSVEIEGIAYKAYVAGFLNDNNEYYQVPGVSSSPNLDNLLRLRGVDEPYIVLTVNSGVIPESVFNMAHSALYIFPPEGESIDAYISEWKNMAQSSWIGNVYSLAEMRDEQVMSELIASSFEFYLVCVWGIALFFVGLQGFFAYIVTRAHRQLAVYRMLGMNRARWVIMISALLYLPVMLFAVLGNLLVKMIGLVRIDRASELLLALTLLFAVLFMLPALIIEIRAWRKSAVEFRNKEARA